MVSLLQFAPKVNLQVFGLISELGPLVENMGFDIARSLNLGKLPHLLGFQIIIWQNGAMTEYEEDSLYQYSKALRKFHFSPFLIYKVKPFHQFFLLRTFPTFSIETKCDVIDLVYFILWHRHGIFVSLFLMSSGELQSNNAVSQWC